MYHRLRDPTSESDYKMVFVPFFWVLVLIRQGTSHPNSISHPGDGLNKTLEITFEGFQASQTRQGVYEL